MARFTKCGTPEIYFLHVTYTNNPVNLELCSSVESCEESSGYGGDPMYCIVFHGCDARWRFLRKAMRDAEYDRIVNGSESGP